MTYARARLLVGTSGVGTVVVLAAAALLLDLPARFLPAERGAALRDVQALAAVLAIHIGVLAPFDLLGGYLLPKRFGRSQASLGRFLRGWVRGVAMQAILVMVCAILLLTAGRLGGTAAATGVLLLSMVVLLAAQATVASLLAPLEIVRRDARSDRVRSGDVGFTGGIVGLPGRERFLVPEGWDDLLGGDGVAAQLTRWQSALASRSRLLGLLVALGWNLLGFLLAARLPGAGVTDVAGLVTLALGFNLWCFLGLLLLPSISRRGVFAADRLALERIGDEELLRRTLARLDGQQDDEPERGPVVESVFHPIPALSRRLDRLRRGDGPRVGAWHAARTALYLSLAGFGLLSRAVHCNSGRPDLWALLPCD